MEQVHEYTLDSKLSPLKKNRPLELDRGMRLGWTAFRKLSYTLKNHLSLIDKNKTKKFASVQQ